MRFLLLLFVFLLSLSPLEAQTNKQIRKLQSQQKTLKKEIANQESLLKSTKKDVRSQLANLQVINTQIEGQQKYVDGIHAEITELASNIEGLQRQIDLLEKDLEDCKRKYRHAVTYMFRNRLKFSKWRFILSAQNFRQMYRRMRYVTEFSRYQRQQGLIIQEKEAEVKARKQEMLGVKKEKDARYAEGVAETQKLEGKKKERQQVVNELNKKQAQLQKSIAQQKKTYDQLNARIDKLIQQEIIAAEKRRKAEEARRRKEQAAREAKARREREEAERQKRNTATANKKSGGRNTAATSSKSCRSSKASTKRDEVFNNPRIVENSDHALTNSFASNRGRLPMPITGSYSITTHFGTYNVAGLNGVQLDSKGINITGRPGAQARCVFRGEVTAVFPYGGVYNVIVRHGSYMSVYCNLSSISVRRGQNVEARQTIGAVATDGSGNCTLHFQLRKETARLNPETWLAR